MGFSATLGSFLFSLADTGLIIAYVRGLGQISLLTFPTPFFYLFPPTALLVGLKPFFPRPVLTGVYLSVPARPNRGNE
jgi:hypothetical protein